MKHMLDQGGMELKILSLKMHVASHKPRAMNITRARKITWAYLSTLRRYLEIPKEFNKFSLVSIKNTE